VSLFASEFNVHLVTSLWTNADLRRCVCCNNACRAILRQVFHVHLDESISDVHVGGGEVCDKIRVCRSLGVRVTYIARDHCRRLDSWITVHVHSYGGWLWRTRQ